MPNKRGRRSGSVKRPQQFHLHVWLIVQRYIADVRRRTGKTISDSLACKEICVRGGLRWLLVVAPDGEAKTDEKLGISHRVRAETDDLGVKLIPDRQGIGAVTYTSQHAPSLRTHYTAAKKRIEDDPVCGQTCANILADVTGQPRISNGWVGWRPPLKVV
jgi:hypothetical protein